jgi:hypothetical protein
MFGSFIQWRNFVGKTFNKNQNTFTVPQVSLAGLLTGWTVSTIVVPIEQIKARLQVQYALPQGVEPLYKGPIDCMVKLVKNNGFLGLYKGFVPTIMTRSGKIPNLKKVVLRILEDKNIPEYIFKINIQREV